MTNPCNNCNERKVGCHANCDEYLDWRHKVDEINEKSEKARKIERSLRFGKGGKK